jgi:transcriptional regulator with XRE-family HTH domain
MNPDVASMGRAFGEVIRTQREAKGLDLVALSQAIGGTPSQGFLAKVEEGQVGPSSSVVLRIAAVLQLPPDLMLNASGFATEPQRVVALSALGGVTGTGRPTNGV